MKVKAISKETGKEISLKKQRDVTSYILNPIMSQYIFVSPIMNRTLELYKDEPIIPHIMTESERRKLKENPDYVNDIPKFDVPGYDRVVSNERFERKMISEFYHLLISGDLEIVKFVNNSHPTIQIICEE